MQDWNVWMYDDRPIAEQMKELAERNNTAYWNLRKEIYNEISQKALQGKRWHYKVICGYNDLIIKLLVQDLVNEQFRVEVKEDNTLENRYRLSIYW